MIRLSKIAFVAVAGLFSVSVSGCFTGIESTPRISDSEVERKKPAATVEETYLSDISANTGRGIAPGKKWTVADKKISLVMSPPDVAAELNVGDTLTLTAINEVVTVDGNRVAELSFSDPRGHSLTRRTAAEVKDLSKQRVEIPFAVETDLVDAVRTRMLGKSYYLLSSSRTDSTGNMLRGPRFIPATVNSVTAGNTYYPIKLHLTDSRGARFFLFMTVDESSSLPGKFSSLLSISDPKLKYPSITDDVWALIIDGRVRAGMTKPECRLSFGAPDNIDRQVGYSILREIWTYENGRYLIFSDGLLESFRQ